MFQWVAPWESGPNTGPDEEGVETCGCVRRRRRIGLVRIQAPMKRGLRQVTSFRRNSLSPGPNTGPDEEGGSDQV